MTDMIDIHTHTYASGHAYSTMREVITAAKDRGLEVVGIADHAPRMPGSAHELHFLNLKAIPRDAYGIKLMLGAELNIMDYSGSTDLPGHIMRSLDYAIASLHNPCLEPSTLEDNTAAIVGAMRNPYVRIIGHPDNPHYPVDFEAIANAAKAHRVLLEVNNHSYNSTGYRKGSREKAKLMLAACKKFGTSVIMGSDAHIDLDVGHHEQSIEVLEENHFPPNLVVNTDLELFRNFFK